MIPDVKSAKEGIDVLEEIRHKNIAHAIVKALDEAEELRCTCDKRLEIECNRCCLIETLGDAALLLGAIAMDSE